MKLGPFTRGINRSKARTQLGTDELWDAQGVYQVERGRLRACFEGTSVDQINSVNNTFTFLKNSYSAWAATTAYSVNDEVIPITADGFVYRCYDPGTSGGSAPTFPAAIGSTVTDSGVEWRCVGVDVDEAPERMTLWNDQSLLLAQSDYKGCLSNSSIRLSLAEDAAAKAWAVDYGDWLIVCVDKQPIRAYSKDNHTVTTYQFNPIYNGDSVGLVFSYWIPSNGYSLNDLVIPTFAGLTGLYYKVTTDAGSAGATEPAWPTEVGGTVVDGGLTWTAQTYFRVDYRNYTQVQGEPVWLYLSYTEVGSVLPSASAGVANIQGTSTAFRGAAGPHGYGATWPANRFVTAAHMWAKQGSRKSEDLYKRGIVGTSSSGGTTDDLESTHLRDNGVGADGVATGTLYNYRAGVSQQQAMGRFPVVYKGQFVFCEARQYNYSNLGGGVGKLINLAGTTQFTVSSRDMTDVLHEGDELIIFESETGTNPTSGVHDYVWDKTNTGIVTISSLFYVTSTTTSHINITPDWAGAIGGTAMWATRRVLKSFEKRRIYFAGRKADVSNSIAVDVRDFLKIETNNNTIIGEDSQGDITGMWAQGDDRLIIGLESGLWEMFGDLPIDGIEPPGFGTNQISGSVGVFSDTAGTFDDTGNIFYFASGSDFGIYRLYGQTVERMDEPIREHPQHPANASTPASFSHIIFANKRLYCMTNENDPYVWIFDSLAGAWTYTKRVNSGQDQTGTLPALELSDGGYASNILYPASGDHGGVFAPYRAASSEVDRAIAIYDDGSNYSARTLNHTPDEHNLANLIHGVQVQTGYVDGGTQAPKRIRQIRVLNTKPLLDDSGGSAFTEAKVAATTSEGETTLSRDVTPDWTDSQGDSNKYRVQGVGGRGDTSISITVNDGISPMGEIDSIEIDVIPMEWRNR